MVVAGGIFWPGGKVSGTVWGVPTTTAVIIYESLQQTCSSIAKPQPFKNSFHYSGALLWNSLHSDLRQAESLNDSCHQMHSYRFFSD